MKKVLSIFILTFFYLISYSQKEEYKISRLIIAYYGDSTLLTEKYEIDFSKKKVYYITPIANNLDIKGTKFRTKISLNKKEWKEIARLGLMIDFERLEQYSESNTQKSIYSIERISDHNRNLILRLAEENMTEVLRKLFETIRNLK